MTYATHSCTTPMIVPFNQLQEAFNQQRMPSRKLRQFWLDNLCKLLIDNQNAIIEAINNDFGNRSKDETLLAELMPSVQNIHYCKKNLKRWMRPQKRNVGLAFQPAKARVMYQPLGVVGIIVPWNYPLFLAIGPLACALAAGNRVMLKMSEYTPAFSALFKSLIERYFPADLVRVETGDASIAAEFSTLPFAHLLFTGSTAVGYHVMRAAAENLTPVTLELGGKSPAIIGHDMPMPEIMQRLLFGKTMNAGQTCVAPDYVLVPSSRIDEFIAQAKITFSHLFPSITDNADYTSIINERHLARLQDYLDDAISKGGVVIPLGQNEKDDRRMPLHLILQVNDDMRVMQDEIFGPILPVLSYNSLDQALSYIQERPKPLALYYFGYQKTQQHYVLEQTLAGGVCINDTLSHVAQEDLPFGGVGASGMGHYHGHEGFLTFSKAKPVFSKQRFNGAKVIYPPYGGFILKMVYRLFIR